MPAKAPRTPETPLTAVFFQHAAILAHKPSAQRSFLVEGFHSMKAAQLEKCLAMACRDAWEQGDEDPLPMVQRNFWHQVMRNRAFVDRVDPRREESLQDFEKLLGGIVARVYREFENRLPVPRWSSVAAPHLLTKHRGYSSQGVLDEICNPIRM